MMNLPTQVQQLIDDDRCLAAYVSGSTLAGLGTPTSDVDIFVIMAEAEAALPLQVHHDGERYDVEVIRESELRGWVTSCVDHEFTFANIMTIHPFLDDLDQAARLHYATILKDAHGLLHEQRERLANDFPRFREMVVARWALRVNNFHEDFAGFVMCGDRDGSFYSSQSILTSGVKALTASTGLLYLGEKWALRQLRTFHPLLADQVADQLRGEWQDREHGATVLLQGVQGLLAAAALQHQGLPVADSVELASGASGGPTRHPMYVPLLTRSEVTLNWERRHQVGLRGGVLAVWLACDGADVDTAWKRVSSWFGRSGRSLQRSRFDRSVESLTASGLLIEPATARGYLRPHEKACA